MLQQTQVRVVIPYYQRFLARFPTVETLAAAPLDDVLSHWRGLGYYARARNLHRAAQEVVARHGGALPRTAEGLRTLPGVGRYTAGAVASIAFQERAPVVDGNVARVLSRLFAVEGAPGDRAREARLWALAGELVQTRRPGDLNQALMELGATVCSPDSPGCVRCPLRRRCEALAQDRVDALPPPKVRPGRRRLHLRAALCARGATVLLGRRAESGLFGGLWELPCVEGGEAPAPQALAALLGRGAVVERHVQTVQRALTHRDLVIDVYRARVPRGFAGPRGYAEWRWTALPAARALGMSTAMAAALEGALVAPAP